MRVCLYLQPVLSGFVKETTSAPATQKTVAMA